MTFLGNTITSEGVLPNKTKVSEFLSTLKIPKTQTNKTIYWILPVFSFFHTET